MWRNYWNLIQNWQIIIPNGTLQLNTWFWLISFHFFFYNFFRLKISASPNATEETPTGISKRSNGAKFGDASFDVAPKTTTNTNVLTVIGEDEGNAKDTAIFVLYEKFNGTLIHDPTLSLESDGTSFEQQTLIIVAMLSIIAVVLGITVVIASLISIAVVATRKNQYESV
jgi:hypothetical protein